MANKTNVSQNYLPSKSVKWTVKQVEIADDVNTHFSDEFNIYLTPLGLNFKFRLVLKIRLDHFELYVESLVDRDLELKLAVKMRSNNRQRQMNEVFKLVGKYEEDHTQYSSLYWGGLFDLFWQGLPRNTKMDVKVEILFLDLLVRCNRYPKPRFLSSHSQSSSGEGTNYSLASDMWKAFLSETGADLTITCESFMDDSNQSTNDDEENTESEVIEQRPARATFRVQKGILTSRSDVFAAMFSHGGFSEAETSTLHITDMSPQALREMLRFLYTDKMENANIYAKELLRAASKYNIPRMKLLAEEALCQSLTDETVLEVAKFAHMYHGNAAKEFAISCIVANFSTLIKRPEWGTFVKDNLDLLHEIHLRIASKLETGQTSRPLIPSCYKL